MEKRILPVLMCGKCYEQMKEITKHTTAEGNKLVEYVHYYCVICDIGMYTLETKGGD